MLLTRSDVATTTPNLKFGRRVVVLLSQKRRLCRAFNLLNVNNSKTHFAPYFIISEIENHLSNQ